MKSYLVHTKAYLHNLVEPCVRPVRYNGLITSAVLTLLKRYVSHTFTCVDWRGFPRLLTKAYLHNLLRTRARQIVCRL